MFKALLNGKKEEVKDEKNDQNKFWLFRVKGTVSEPWPTAKDLWNDPKVRKIINAHNESVKKSKKNGA